jgi:hypothetical protein
MASSLLLPGDRPCPDHRMFWYLMQCARCMGIFWDRMDKRGKLDAEERATRTRGDRTEASQAASGYPRTVQRPQAGFKPQVSLQTQIRKGNGR